MKRKMTVSLLASAAAAVVFALPAYAQQSAGVPNDPRPADPTANLPSATGSQTTLPSGAVTGAGQPQGTTRQPEVGAPGGLQPRARQEAREAAAAGADGATGATAGSAEGRVPDAGRDAPRR